MNLNIIIFVANKLSIKLLKYPQHLCNWFNGKFKILKFLFSLTKLKCLVACISIHFLRKNTLKIVKSIFFIFNASATTSQAPPKRKVIINNITDINN